MKRLVALLKAVNAWAVARSNWMATANGWLIELQIAEVKYRLARIDHDMVHRVEINLADRAPRKALLHQELDALRGELDANYQALQGATA